MNKPTPQISPRHCKECGQLIGSVHCECAPTHTASGLLCWPLEHTRRYVAGGVAVDVVYRDARTTVTHATINAANLERR